METQLQEAHDTKTSLEAEIKLLQALPAQIRDLEVQCARKERELSLLQARLSQNRLVSPIPFDTCNQVSAAQAQEELKTHCARTRSEAFMVDRRLVSNLLVQVRFILLCSKFARYTCHSICF